MQQVNKKREGIIGFSRKNQTLPNVMADCGDIKATALFKWEQLKTLYPLYETGPCIILSIELN